MKATSARQTEKEFVTEQALTDSFMKPILGELTKQIWRHRNAPEKMNFDKIQLALRQALQISLLLGNDAARTALKKQVVDKENYGLIDDLARGIVMQKSAKRTVFQKALSDLMKRRPALKHLLKSKRPDILKRVFYISRLFELKTVRRAKKLLEKALKEGWSPAKWRNEVIGFTGLAKRHLDTVFRTNVSTALESGKREAFTDPDLADFILGFEYRALVKDGRARDSHAAMNGFIAPANHEIWKRVWTPAGYSCRCSILPITIIKARKNGWLAEDGKRLDPKQFPSYLAGGERKAGLPEVYRKGIFPDRGFKR